ncbi:Panacea domain-containing protein [Asticcacaulis excentricus]|uniref:Panacea domain-containing protein n=1 Tax=Asticcacaulis excentricus TaxID=78587 RepID=UPI000F81D3C9|nr:type II toxin-antitoxin system antitoxin SocA domain-containing protein [Asticcacaulis excentricus]
MANVFDVAKYVLRLAAEKGEPEMTTWKLQKLVYYSQAWSLVWDDQPIFEEQIQAWANGPVCPDLYQRHKGQFKITANSLDAGDHRALTKAERETVEAVVRRYGKKTAHYLSELTHQEAPWKRARKGVKDGERSEKPISHADMAEYYGGL